KLGILNSKLEIRRKAFLLLFFIFNFSHFVFAQEPKDGYQKFYYPSGQLSSEGTLLNGKPNGYWKSYYESGKIKSEGNRVNFKLDSLWKFYNDSGYVTAEYNYNEGARHGLQKTYYANG